MDRSSFVRVAALASLLSPLPASAAKPLRVAFAISDMANVIDLAGAWETFQDVDGSPFVLCTVAKDRQTVVATGGLRLQPEFTFEDVPQPNIVVVGAQHGSPELHAWLRAQHNRADLVMSVCTGAFQLARAGILDGKRATTHHEFYTKFAAEFPKVTLVRGPRFVDEGSICTAGGLTSGINLAMHVVARYFGEAAASNVAAYMEFVPQNRAN